LVQSAIRVRKGADPRAGQGTGVANSTTDAPLGPDAYEPNNTLATATNLSGLYPPSLLTGNPLVLTGLTLTANDVDFFAFDTAALTIVHAETSGVTGLPAPDTLMGLFDTPAGHLLAHDDDGAGNGFSKLAVPIEATGKYAVAVESAPDSNLDFTGSQGTTTGTYNLSLEIELGSYLWNQFDLIIGVSPDGTFIEDFVGFKEIGPGGQDTLLVGVPADGWAWTSTCATPDRRHARLGGGDQLTDPGFPTAVPSASSLVR
jgi:hypothetical protein